MKHLLFTSLVCITLANGSFAQMIHFTAKRNQSAIQTFNQMISEGNVVVDFYADWCGPCKRLTPIFNKLSNECNNVTFIKVNQDEYPAIAREYKIRSIPNVIFFKDGKQVDSVIGNKPADIKEKVKKHF